MHRSEAEGLHVRDVIAISLKMLLEARANTEIPAYGRNDERLGRRLYLCENRSSQKEKTANSPGSERFAARMRPESATEPALATSAGGAAGRRCGGYRRSGYKMTFLPCGREGNDTLVGRGWRATRWRG